MEVDFAVLLYFILFIFLTILLCGIVKTWLNVNQRRFPGPRALPFVGNALSLDVSRLHLSFSELAKLYGGIFQISFVGTDVVVINDIKLARKAFLSDEYGKVFCDRPEHFFGKYIMFNFADIGTGKCDQKTYTLRRILQKGLKVFGEGVTRFESHVTEELDRLISDINNQGGMDFDLGLLLKQSFGNWMSSLITGDKSEEGDSKIIWNFLEAMNALINPGWNYVLETLPFLRKLPGKPGNMFRVTLHARDELLDRFYYLEKKAKVENPRGSRGLLAALNKLRHEENDKAGYDIIGTDNFKGMLIDIFFGGTETTMTALTNAFAVLLKYPECIEKLQTEIDSVIGRSREPSLNDRANMPFTKAFILELHRFTSEVPLAFPHKPVMDVIFEGHCIKRDSQVILNSWFIHHDSKIWTDPWEFRPERFLDSNGQLLSPEHELRLALVPFSIGRRSCPGETLAMTRTFLYLTRIVQAFDIQPPSHGKLPEVDPRSYKPGITLRVEEYFCRALPRDA